MPRSPIVCVGRDATTPAKGKISNENIFPSPSIFFLRTGQLGRRHSTQKGLDARDATDVIGTGDVGGRFVGLYDNRKNPPG